VATNALYTPLSRSSTDEEVHRYPRKSTTVVQPGDISEFLRYVPCRKKEEARGIHNSRRFSIHATALLEPTSLLPPPSNLLLPVNNPLPLPSSLLLPVNNPLPRPSSLLLLVNNPLSLPSSLLLLPVNSLLQPLSSLLLLPVVTRLQPPSSLIAVLSGLVPSATSARDCPA
jgi:hypothetical protein